MNIFETIAAELSGQNAYDLTCQVTQYYRSPGSGGYHAATSTARDLLIRAGLQVEETEYPLDGKTVILDRTMPLAWEPYNASVRVISPVQEEIIDFDKASSCLAWWSTPTPQGGITAELVDVGTGENEEDYEGKDLTGKVAFVRNTNWHVTWSRVSEDLARRGAAGIISDFFLYPTEPVRTRTSVPEAVQLLRLEFNARQKYNLWACAVDYPTSQRLQALLRLGPVKIHADIQCSTFEGFGQNILATIPGTDLSEEAVFVLAHSSAGCRPGANCASGTALLVEIARTLQKLVDSGALPRPRRSIKFLMVSEGLGSYQYINSHPEQMQRVKASYCLESVGHSQRKTDCTLYFSKSPDSIPSFLNDHFEAVLERAPKQWGWVGSSTADISPVVVSSVPYTPWSDNSTWAANGIPSALLMSWPDRYFHSQLLSAELTDPRVFAFSGLLVAASVYEIACAGLREAQWLAQWMFARSTERLQREKVQSLWQNGSSDPAWTQKRLDYVCTRDCKALEALLELVDAADRPTLQAQIAQFQSQLASIKEQALV